MYSRNNITKGVLAASALLLFIACKPLGWAPEARTAFPEWIRGEWVVVQADQTPSGIGVTFTETQYKLRLPPSPNGENKPINGENKPIEADLNNPPIWLSFSFPDEKTVLVRPVIGKMGTFKYVREEGNVVVYTIPKPSPGGPPQFMRLGTLSKKTAQTSPQAQVSRAFPDWIRGKWVVVQADQTPSGIGVTFTETQYKLRLPPSPNGENKPINGENKPIEADLNNPPIWLSFSFPDDKTVLVRPVIGKAGTFKYVREEGSVVVYTIPKPPPGGPPQFMRLGTLSKKTAQTSPQAQVSRAFPDWLRGSWEVDPASVSAEAKKSQAAKKQRPPFGITVTDTKYAITLNGFVAKEFDLNNNSSGATFTISGSTVRIQKGYQGDVEYTKDGDSVVVSVPFDLTDPDTFMRVGTLKAAASQKSPPADPQADLKKYFASLKPAPLRAFPDWIRGEWVLDSAGADQTKVSVKGFLMLFSAAEVRFGETAYSHVLTKKGGATESGNDDVNQNSQITFHFPGDQLPGGDGANFVVVGGTSPSAGNYSLKYVKESGGVAVKIGAGGGQFDHLGTLGKKPGKKP